MSFAHSKANSNLTTRDHKTGHLSEYTVWNVRIIINASGDEQHPYTLYSLCDNKYVINSSLSLSAKTANDLVDVMQNGTLALIKKLHSLGETGSKNAALLNVVFNRHQAALTAFLIGATKDCKSYPGMFFCTNPGAAQPNHPLSDINIIREINQFMISTPRSR